MSLYKLNLHAHTEYSDGHGTIWELAQMYKIQGFCCCVITDHYYGKEDLESYSLTPVTFKKAIVEAAEISKVLNFPIIIGAECVLEGMEEINVFGREAIEYLMAREDWLNIEDFRYVRNNFLCSTSLNHPSLTKSLAAGVGDVIDGFERYNAGQDYFESRILPKEFTKKGLTQYSNSDAHSIRSLDVGYNLVDENIKSEKELINFMASKKFVINVAEGRVKHKVAHFLPENNGL